MSVFVCEDQIVKVIDRSMLIDMARLSGQVVGARFPALIYIRLACADQSQAVQLSDKASQVCLNVADTFRRRGGQEVKRETRRTKEVTRLVGQNHQAFALMTAKCALPV